MQDYSNHIKFYPPHHFVFYPVVMVLFGTCIWLAGKYEGQSFIWAAFAIILIMLGWLSFMMRQHYALSTQNRLVRLEMRLRYYQLTHRKFEYIEDKLSFPQLAALRFAPDDELLPLIEETLKNNLSPETIKKSITNWLPDNMRV